MIIQRQATPVEFKTYSERQSASSMHAENKWNYWHEHDWINLQQL